MELSTEVVEFGVGVIDRDFSLERFIDLRFDAWEAEAFGLGRDMEAASVPLYEG